MVIWAVTMKRKRRVVHKVGTIAAAAYFPEFLRIHLRYMRHNFWVWAALFIAPFLAVKLALISLFNSMANENSGVWKFDLMAIFIVAFCFFLAERNRKFRQVYVNAAPLITGASLLYWMGADHHNYLSVDFGIKAALIAWLSLRIWRFSKTKGYQQLTEGGDKDYARGKAYYENQEYNLALPLLEKAAKHGHFKSLYLIGDAYEYGHHYGADPFQAAAHFRRASKRGYAKANARYDALLPSLTETQITEIEIDWF